MGFSDVLNNLGSVLQQQFNLGENRNTTLDIAQNGNVQRYGKLGDFANQFDQSAERSYTEEGSFRNDLLNPKPKQLDLLMQDPDITVFIKKRAFASLAENYRPDLMDEQERLFYKATKILFQKKCEQISNFEKLTKIQHISNQIGQVDYYLLPILFSATDNLNQLIGSFPGLGGFQDTISSALSSFTNVVNQVRQIVGLTQDNRYTSWVVNSTDSFQTNFGQGTGVIELTIVSHLRTTSSINFGGGSCSFEVIDPYELMLITNNDIEIAISEANSQVLNNNFIQLGIQSLDDTISQQKQELNLKRQERGANPINFIVDPNTYLGRRVRALVDIIGFDIKFDGSAIGSVSVDPSALFGAQTIGKDGLTNSEVSLFGNIINSIFTKLSLNQTTRNTAIQNNLDTNKVRQKLRLHYHNKMIIQPMDNIHVYIGSKTKMDNQIVGGLQTSFSGVGFLQGVQSTLQNLQDSFNTLSGYSIEKSVFVGNDFPTWLWMAMRNQIVSDKNGAHVFAGVVESVNSSYSNGSFRVSVEAKDNTKYFDLGVVNFKPSVDVFNGSLYDPLTPFDIKFDTVTGVQKNSTPDLLPENKAIFDSAFVKNKNGLLAGAKPTEKTFLNQDSDRSQSSDVRRVFYDPDGFVYRWKEGIGTLVLFGDSHIDNPAITTGTPSITNDPFAGQDIMNVLSLLISGQPYNFATFYKAVQQFQGLQRDPITGETSATSYFRALQTGLKYRNAIYGNFIPFKRLVVDDKSYQSMLMNQSNAQAFDADLQQLLEERATLSDRLTFLTGKSVNSGISAISSADVQALTSAIAEKDAAISSKITAIQNELFKSDAPVSIFGNDISYEYDPVLNVGQGKTNLNSDDRRELRRKINYLTRRLIWKVRGNLDENLLIVDDSYDKDTDIQAFEKSFADSNAIQTFKSEYIKVSDQIRTLQEKLHLEVFANSQGHIEIRVPQFNKIPSTVFYRMLRLKNEMGLQVYPQYIEDLYTTQLTTLYNQIEAIECQIRLYCLSLNYIDDASCQNFINNNSGTVSSGLLSVQSSSFRFLSGEDSPFTIDSQSIQSLMETANPDQLELANAAQQAFGIVNGQTTVNVFDVGVRASLLQSSTGSVNNKQSISSFKGGQVGLSREADLVNAVFNKTGQQFDTSQIFGKTKKVSGTISSVDYLHILNQISTLISQRQQAVKLAANALKNIKEAASAFSSNNAITNNLLLPSMNDSKSIPQMFEHMIEDEFYDDLGIGSSKRYVIGNNKIISLSITESHPPFTAVDVIGRFGDQFISNNQLPSDLNAFEQGNALTTASAVDYDLWRMYGISLPTSQDCPWITDPNTQAAPYAVSLLSRARKEILSGNLVMVGNEYQQPGEVIYLENRDMLFYVESVSHDFTFGSTFTTSLNLCYGHNPGEYIPNPLDIFGKVLYRNKDLTNYVHKKQGNSFNQEHIGVIAGNPDGTEGINGIEDDIYNGQFGDSNAKNIKNIISQAAGILSEASGDYIPQLEVRIYYNTSDDYPQFNNYSSYAKDLMDSVVNILTGESSNSTGISFDISSKNSQPSLKSFKDQIIPKIVNTSVDEQGEFRYPSAKAFHIARSSLGNNSVGLGNLLSGLNIDTSSLSNSQLQQQVDQVIYNCIVDCWIVFKNNANS